MCLCVYPGNPRYDPYRIDPRLHPRTAKLLGNDMRIGKGKDRMT